MVGPFFKKQKNIVNPKLFNSGVIRKQTNLKTKQLFIYNPKSEKVGTVWKMQIKKESSDF